MGGIDVGIQAPPVVVPPAHITVRISASGVDGMYVVVEVLELNKTVGKEGEVPLVHGIAKEFAFHVEGNRIDIPLVVNRSGAVLVGLVGEKGEKPVVVVSNVLTTLVVEDLGRLERELVLCRENASRYARLYEELSETLAERGNTTVELSRIVREKEGEIASLKANLTLLREELLRLNNSYLNALKTIESLRSQLARVNRTVVETVTITHRIYEPVKLEDPWRSVVLTASTLAFTLAVLLLVRVWRLS